MTIGFKMRCIGIVAIFVLSACASTYKRSDEVAKYRESLNLQKTKDILASLFSPSPTTGGICRVGVKPARIGASPETRLKFDYPRVTFQVVGSEYAGSSVSGAMVSTRSRDKIETVTVNIKTVEKIMLAEAREGCNSGIGGYLAYVSFDDGGGFVLHLPKARAIEGLAALTFSSPGAPIVVSLNEAPKD
jgi:hypothetical protein